MPVAYLGGGQGEQLPRAALSLGGVESKFNWKV